MTVAMSEAEGLKYLLTDHLGSVAAITDDQGTLLDQQRYLPFGAERVNVGSITQTEFGYTGQRDMPSMGPMDYKARFYDSSIGRFIQPDSIIPNPADPQSWNRYAYVRGNPLRFADPTGHYIVEKGDCTQLSCSGDPDPGDVKRLRKQREEIAELVGMVDQLIQACRQTPYATGCLSTAPPPGGYSSPQLDALYLWWDSAVRNANDLVCANDLYNLTSKGGWKAARWGLNLTALEVLVQGSRQVYRDSSLNSLTPAQRWWRPVLVGAEAGFTDFASGVGGVAAGGAGFAVAGPPGAAVGYIIGAAATSGTGEALWSYGVNPTFFDFLGPWP